MELCKSGLTVYRTLIRKLRIRSAHFTALIILSTFIAAAILPVASSSASLKLVRSRRTSAALTPVVNRPGDSPAAALRGHATLAAPALEPLLPAPPVAETVATYAADCTTPKTSFLLGETVCARVTGAPAPIGGTYARRRIQWANTVPFAIRQTDVLSDTQTDLFTLPTSATSTVNEEIVDNRGVWRVNIIDRSEGSATASTTFTVRDPANAAVDLSVVDVSRNDSGRPAVGSDVVFVISIKNNGPDSAANVTLTTAVPNNTTFVLMTQSAGPTASCNNPPPGGTSTSTCTISSLPNGAEAILSFTYHVQSGTADDTQITSTATVTSATTEKYADNNTASSTVNVSTPTCTITPPSDITQQNDLDGTGKALGGAVVTYNAPTTSSTVSPSSCGIVECTLESGSFFPIGVNTVTCSDGANEAVHFQVTITDTEAPTISCPSNVNAFESSPGSGSATVNYPDPVAADNSGKVTVTTDHPSGSQFPVGTTTVNATATDDAGRTATCSFTVTVSESDCAITCPSDITHAVEPGQSSAIVNYPAASSTGTCGPITYSQDSGTSFPVGITTVTVTTQTGHTCSFKVNVISDTTGPMITCPSDINVAAAAGACSASVTVGTPTATDDATPSDQIQIAGSRNDGLPLTDPYPAGETLITWTATDGAGNASTCAQSVHVNDVTPPTITAPPGQTAAGDANCQAAVPNFVPGTTTSDNCSSGPVVVGQDIEPGTLVGTGTHTITLTATDGAGNTATATTTFTVTDSNPPTITLNGANPMTVECHTSFTDPGATATDQCTGTFPATPSGTVDVDTPGTYTITYNASDSSGNAAQPVTRTVIVVDTTAPVITVNGANPMTVECHTSFTDPGATANDSCAGSFAATASGSVNVDVPGTYTITYNASDPSGNAATAVTRTVIVVDTTAPTITLKNVTIKYWPPNHNYQTVNITDLVQSVTDGCDTTVDMSDVFISQVTSDETENGNGDGNTMNDIIINADCKSVRVRSERNANGNGRVYTVTMKVRDASGNTATVTSKLYVPKNSGGNPVDDGPSYVVQSGCQ